MRNAFVLAVLVALLHPTPARADERTPLRVLNIGYTTAAALDGYLTVWCSARETCHEANPILRPMVERRGVVAAMTVKTGLQAGISAWLWKTSDQHPRRNFWITLGLFSAQLYVDAHNYRAMRSSAVTR